jgi:hypothetical protein
VSNLIGGMMMLSTKDAIFLKAAPMTPTAKSMTFPRIANLGLSARFSFAFQSRQGTALSESPDFEGGLLRGLYKANWNPGRKNGGDLRCYFCR